MKKIFGFQVCINDEKICRAGFENKNSIVTCILDSVRRENDDAEELNLYIGGLNSDTHQSVRWLNGKLEEGDKVSFEVISNNFDKPSSVSKAYSKQDIINQKLRSYHKLKEELKDYLED